jgi:peptide/nickel transport system permease protein
VLRERRAFLLTLAASLVALGLRAASVPRGLSDRQVAALEVLGLEYLRTARAKGLGEATVVLRHGLRNALIPVITIPGIDIPVLFSAAVITETIFAWPGMGRLLRDGIFANDWPVVTAVIMITAFLVTLGNLLADILYGVVDPRIRYT